MLSFSFIFLFKLINFRNFIEKYSIMENNVNIKLFESKKIRTHWDEAEEKWYFSVVDVVEALTDSSNPRDYWFKMKTRVKSEDGIELSTICRQLKLTSSGANKKVDTAADDRTGNPKQIDRLLERCRDKRAG